MQKNILLVDDESSLRRSLSVALSQEGYTIEPCENGINAIKKLHTYKQNNLNLDTAILDIHLRDIDGIKLGKIIKQKYPETNIIFMSEFSDKSDNNKQQEIPLSKILEKPFTVQELTKQIEELRQLSKATSLSAEIKTQEKSVQDNNKPFSAYALLKLESKEDFFSIYRQLYFDKNILYCDATKGDYDIFLLIQAESFEECRKICENNIKKIKGVKELDCLEVSNPILDESLRSILNVFSIEPNGNQTREMRNAVCSYVLVEIEREKMDTVYPTLYFDDNIVYCDYIESKSLMILLVNGAQFTEIDHLIKNKISTIDGILKVKEYPIITIYEM